MQVQQVIKNLRDDLTVLQEASSEISSALNLLEKFTGLRTPVKKVRRKSGKRRKLSAEARKRIGDAARARWAKRKAEGK